MTGPTHEVLGATAGVAAGVAFGLPLEGVAVLGFCAAASSRVPDLLEVGVLRHRRSTHCVFALVAFVALCAVGSMAGGVLVAANAGLVLGYAMHLVADMCTPHGVPLAWPVSDRCVHVLPRAWRVRTGSFRESVVVFVAPVVTVLVLLGASS